MLRFDRPPSPPNVFFREKKSDRTFFSTDRGDSGLRKLVQHAFLLFRVGLDIAENEPSEVSENSDKIWGPKWRYQGARNFSFTLPKMTA